jgi:hypothetical protein
MSIICFSLLCNHIPFLLFDPLIRSHYRCNPRYIASNTISSSLSHYLFTLYHSYVPKLSLLNVIVIEIAIKALIRAVLAFSSNVKRLSHNHFSTISCCFILLYLWCTRWHRLSKSPFLLVKILVVLTLELPLPILAQRVVTFFAYQMLSFTCNKKSTLQLHSKHN